MRTNGAAGLGRMEQRTVRAMVPVVCPPEVVTHDLVDDVVDHVATTVASLSPLTRRGLSVALMMIEVSGVRRGARFSRLSPPAAEATLASLTNGPPLLRRLVRSVRDVIVMAYFDQPAVKDRLGYRPAEWTATTAARWHREWGQAAERHRELLGTPLPRPGSDR